MAFVTWSIIFVFIGSTQALECIKCANFMLLGELKILQPALDLIPNIRTINCSSLNPGQGVDTMTCQKDLQNPNKIYRCGFYQGAVSAKLGLVDANITLVVRGCIPVNNSLTLGCHAHDTVPEDSATFQKVLGELHIHTVGIIKFKGHVCLADDEMAPSNDSHIEEKMASSTAPYSKVLYIEQLTVMTMIHVATKLWLGMP